MELIEDQLEYGHPALLRQEAAPLRNWHCTPQPTLVQVQDEDEAYLSDATQLPEAVLQAVWQDQPFHRKRSQHHDLFLEDGRKLIVIHPGIWNVSAGPDFHDALVVIGGDLYRGAIEIHDQPSSWAAHGHDLDSAYDDVVLHVVHHNPTGLETSPPGVPLLVLDRISGLNLHLCFDEWKRNGLPYGRMVQPADKTQFLGQSQEAIQDRLTGLGDVRLLEKTMQLFTDKEAWGREQAAYLKLLDIMGYKSLRQPFAQLGKSVPIESLREHDPWSPLACLLGQAGFIPCRSGQIDPAWSATVRQLWTRYWHQAEGSHPIEWKMRSMRPANHPVRRLIGGWQLLLRWGWSPWAYWGKWLDEHLEEGDAGLVARALVTVCGTEASAWDICYGFDRKPGAAKRLIGAERALELVVNLILPLGLAIAIEKQDRMRVQRLLDIFHHLPRQGMNRALKEASHLFFYPASHGITCLKRACHQQGLLHLYRNWLGKGAFSGSGLVKKRDIRCD